MPEELICCETIAAITVHIRRVTEAGPKYGGGADSLTLCGKKAAWDTKFDIEEARCMSCRKAAGMSIYPEGLSNA